MDHAAQVLRQSIAIEAFEVKDFVDYAFEDGALHYKRHNIIPSYSPIWTCSSFLLFRDLASPYPVMAQHSLLNNRQAL